MKIKIPEIKKKNKTEEPDEGMITFGLYDSAADSFEVNVRNDEPMLKSAHEDEEPDWKKNIVLNVSGAFILFASVCSFLTAAYAGILIPFCAAGMILFLAITVTEDLKPGKLRWIIAAAAAVILIVTMAVWHTRIGGGLAILSGYFYDMAEQAQAYIYHRFNVPEAAAGSPELCTRLAVVWISCLCGLIMALPTQTYRRGMCAFAAVSVMLAFAYYGLLPSWIWIGVLIIAGIAAASKGSLMPALPLLLTALILFGAVMLISPGESLAVSRADENLRDRLALRSSYIENPDEEQNELSELEKQELQQQDQELQKQENHSITRKTILTLSVIGLIIAAAAAAAFMYWKRLRKRIDSNKAGIDSDDPGEAIRSMFPYCVRWLEAYGIDAAGRPFSSLTAELKEDVTREYAYRYEDMYMLWQEAAYSEHEMTLNQKNQMAAFLNDTIGMVRDASDFKDKIRTKVRYAL